MIFLLAASEPTLFVLLTEQDVANMRGGRTVFVDQRQLGGATFAKVVLSLHPSNEAAKDLIRRAGHAVPHDLAEPQPRVPVEARCKGCQGIMDAGLLLEGMCSMCWKERADHYEALCDITGRKGAP